MFLKTACVLNLAEAALLDVSTQNNNWIYEIFRCTMSCFPGYDIIEFNIYSLIEVKYIVGIIQIEKKTKFTKCLWLCIYSKCPIFWPLKILL